MKEIEITINKDGTITIDQLGFEGKSCDDIAYKLANALGKIVKEQKKPEYYATVQPKTKVSY